MRSWHFARIRRDPYGLRTHTRTLASFPLRLFRRPGPTPGPSLRRVVACGSTIARSVADPQRMRHLSGRLGRGRRASVVWGPLLATLIGVAVQNLGSAPPSTFGSWLALTPHEVEVACRSGARRIRSISTSQIGCFKGSKTACPIAWLPHGGLRNAKHELGGFSARPSPPHLLIVKHEQENPKRSVGKADFERLAVRLRACGNYAIRMEGAAIYAAFEDDADAERFSAVLRPTQSNRESE
jgi:hypothetical protein